MTFDELIDIKPKVRVADILQLFLLGKDDKIYLNLGRYNRLYIDYILQDERIIDDKWSDYYECEVKWIVEEYICDYHDLADLTLIIE